MDIKKKQSGDIVKQAKFIYIAVAGMTFLLGIAFLICQDRIEMKLLAYLVGGVYCLMGAARLLGYFANDLYRLAFQYDMALGIFNVILGILLFVVPSELTRAIGHLTAMLVLLDGLFKLQTAIDGKKFGIHKWKIMLFTSIITCLLAVGCEIAVLLSSKNIPVMIWIGAAFIADGAENIWHTAYSVRVRAQKKGAGEKYGSMFDDNN